MLILGPCLLNSQTLRRVNATKEDIKSGISKKYEYSDSDSYGIIKLVLFKDGTFNYQSQTFNATLESRGKWRIYKRIISLSSSVSERDVPIKLLYQDSGILNIPFRILIPRNLKGDNIKECTVKINNDSTECDPNTGLCVGHYYKINRIKIVFENGMQSKWMNISGEFNAIIPIVQVNFDLMRYKPISNMKYLVGAKTLTPIIK